MISTAQWQGEPRPPRVVFTGGGTLGHLMPGIAVADELRRRWPESALTFVCTCGGAGGEFLRSLLATKGIRLENVSSFKWQGGTWTRAYRALRGMPAFTNGLLSAIALVRRLRPDVVVGLGGYGSVPTVLAAELTDVPAILLEQNARPGKANRLLARWAQLVCCAWPGSAAFLPHPDRAVHTGNPVRRDVAAAAMFPMTGADAVPPSGRKKTLLVMGGSSGAVAINEMMVESLPHLVAHRSWLRVIHSTGPLNLGVAQEAYARYGFDAVVTPFIEDMAAAYRMSDLVVCRSGGTSLAEICAAGKPALLVPFPYAAEDHQRGNAMHLVEAGAAVVMDQFATTPEQFSEMILDLLANEGRLREMAARSRALGRADATDKVVERIQKWFGRKGGVRPAEGQAWTLSAGSVAAGYAAAAANRVLQRNRQ